MEINLKPNLLELCIKQFSPCEFSAISAPGNIADHVVIGFSAISAPGNIADHVVIERQSESTIMFGEGARDAYLCYVTLKFSPDIASTVPHHKHYALEVTENCSPTIDHCVIRSSSVGES